MQNVRAFPKAVKRVSVIDSDGESVVFQKNRKKKKEAGLLRPVARMIRAYADALDAGAKEFKGRNTRSRQKKKNGVFVDLPQNAFKAGKKGVKKLRKNIL
tara:strand:+ start:781 stop:1080 length:300 start_codon:yes stop_codon:yes gene_type:complete